jgi:hypothetical protein
MAFCFLASLSITEKGMRHLIAAKPLFIPPPRTVLWLAQGSIDIHQQQGLPVLLLHLVNFAPKHLYIALERAGPLSLNKPRPCSDDLLKRVTTDLYLHVRCVSL